MYDFKIKILPPRTDITNPPSPEFFSGFFPSDFPSNVVCVSVIYTLVFHWMNALTMVVIMLKASVHIYIGMF
jgi:hypothetical protein